jgi:hypothetical protein
MVQHAGLLQAFVIESEGELGPTPSLVNRDWNL